MGQNWPVSAAGNSDAKLCPAKVGAVILRRAVDYKTAAATVAGDLRSLAPPATQSLVKTVTSMSLAPAGIGSVVGSVLSAIGLVLL